MQANNHTLNGQLQPNAPPSRFELNQILFLFLRNWYWLVLGLGIGLFVSWTILRYATNIYRVNSSVLINNEKQGALSEEAIIQEYVGYTGQSDVEDKLQILRSPLMMRRVVDTLGINTTYYMEGRIKTSEAYGNLPYVLEEAVPLERAYGKMLRIKPLQGNNFALVKGENDTLFCRFGIPFSWQGVTYTVRKNYGSSDEYMYLINLQDPQQTADSYAAKLVAGNTGRSNTISLSLNDPSPEKAIDILNTLIEAYNQSVIEEKNESGQKTLQFINERLAFVTEELFDVEKEVEGFKRENEVPTGIENEAQEFLSKISSTDEKLVALSVQRELLENLKTYILKAENRYQNLPLGSVNNIQALTAIIQEYNNLLFERDQFKDAATAINPAVSTYEERLNFLRNSILLSINTAIDELGVQEKSLEQQLRPIQKKIDQVPTFERELLQIMRQQQIKEQLFLFLLQKREETLLSIAAQVSDTRVLSPPKSMGIVSPEWGRTYTMGSILGLGIPAGIIFLLYYFNNRVHSKEDISRYTQTPFLGSIAYSAKRAPIAISANSRSSVAEMFRLLRTNLHYMAAGNKNQAILVTSTISGEGKSFISINLGISLALTGKKTLLLGLDLRKPKLFQYLKGEPAQQGITNYLVNDLSLADITHPVEGQALLDIIGCGPVPPNPSELLNTPQLARFFEQVRAQYDYIVVDTAPFGLVTDALSLAAYIDQTIIVSRFGKTTNKMLELVEEVYQKKMLPQMGVLLNGMQGSRLHGYGYGYGYGNKNGYGYYEEDKKQGV